MTIRIALLLLLFAFTVLLLAEIFLYMNIANLPELFIKIGLGLWFSAFGLLLITFFGWLANFLLQEVKAYFSASQRSQRQLLFIETKRQQLKQLFFFRALRINYLYELERQQLLKRNNRKHINALSNAINTELQALKTHLPDATFKQLQQENRRYRKQQDSAALLQLQQKINTLLS
jgi:hypothetical protein